MKSLIYVTSRSSRLLLLLLPLAIAAPSAAEDVEYLFGGSFGAGSDYTFRGVSQTMGNYAIQASLEFSLSSGVYAYVWGSNVDFMPDGATDDGASHEVDMAIGYESDISENWSVDVALIRYVFPGTVGGIDYDYNELMAAVWYAGTYSATVAFTGDVDGTSEDSLFYKLGASYELPSDTTLAVNLGHYDLSDAYGAAYSYVEVALAREIGNTAITLAYNDTQGSAGAIYDKRVTGPRLVLSLQIEW